MREIIFRGKRLDNGEWMESGSIVRCSDDGVVWDYYLGTGKPATHEIDEHKNIVASVTSAECLFALIDPETVGQYTGLTDKNGKKIFEGDILHFWSEYRESFVSKCVVKYGRFNCPCCDGVYGWFLDGGDIRYFEDGETSYVICGNIHDNPEFLKGGAE